MAAQHDTARSPKPFFCCLGKDLGSQCKNETHIFVSQKPIERLYNINMGNDSGHGTRATKQSWEPEVIIGPFPNEKVALDFKKNWMDHSRNIESKRRCGLELAAQEREKFADLCYYDKRLLPKHLSTYMRQHEMHDIVLPPDKLQHLSKELSRICVSTNKAMSASSGTGGTTRTSEKRGRRRRRAKSASV